MKSTQFTCILLLAGLSAQASEDLSSELESLSLPSNQAPVSVAREKLYSVQSRYSPLKFKSEIHLGAAKNFTPDSFLISNQANGGYRFHFSDSWSLGAAGSYVTNDYSAAGKRLLELNQEVPDAAFVKYRGELTAGFNTFYGKFRLSMDQVFYFDQYVLLGPGMVWMDLGRSPAAVADIGFAFWFGRHASVRLGVKDYYYEQSRRLGKGMVHDVTGHVDIGLMLGGSS